MRTQSINFSVPYCTSPVPDYGPCASGSCLDAAPGIPKVLNISVLVLEYGSASLGLLVPEWAVWSAIGVLYEDGIG